MGKGLISTMEEITNSWTADLPSSESQEMLMAVKDQIEKDFGLMGFTYCQDFYPTLESMIPELLNCIEILQTQHNSTWMKVVYRVDLTEKQYRFVKNMGGNTPENMSKAVLLREFQKVYTRKHIA
jgi:hypothetical protein